MVEWTKYGHWSRFYSPENLIRTDNDGLLASFGCVLNLTTQISFVRHLFGHRKQKNKWNPNTCKTQWIQSQVPLRRCSRTSRMQDRSCSDWVTVRRSNKNSREWMIQSSIRKKRAAHEYNGTLLNLCLDWASLMKSQWRSWYHDTSSSSCRE